MYDYLYINVCFCTFNYTLKHNINTTLKYKNMPDISICSSEECPLKKKCYRSQAKPSEYWQAYSDFSEALNEDKTECEYFMEIYKDD
jgi:hypothetical protein